MTTGKRSRIRVLTIVSRLNVGGVSLHVIALEEHLDKDRFETILIKGTEGPDEGSMSDLARRKGVTPIVVPELGREISPLDDIVAFLKLIKLIRRMKPDIVSTHLAKAGTLGRIAAKLAGVKVIIHTYHGHVYHGYFGPRKTRIIKGIERFVGSFSTAVVSVSERIADEIVSHGIVPRRKVVTIPLGLELDRFRSIDGSASTFRRQFGCDSGIVTFGIVARLVPIKGHDLLLKAVARVRERLPDFRLFIIGDGECRDRLESLCDQLHLRDRVVFTGFRSDLADVYSGLDIVVLSSLNEGLPVTIIEAMASGKPVVATDVGGVRDLVEHGTNGLIVPPSDIDALADAMIRLAADPQLRERMGRAGRASVYPRLSYQRLILDVEDFYQRLVGDDRDSRRGQRGNG